MRAASSASAASFATFASVSAREPLRLGLGLLQTPLGVEAEPLGLVGGLGARQGRVVGGLGPHPRGLVLGLGADGLREGLGLLLELLEVLDGLGAQVPQLGLVLGALALGLGVGFGGDPVGLLAGLGDRLLGREGGVVLELLGLGPEALDVSDQLPGLLVSRGALVLGVLLGLGHEGRGPLLRLVHHGLRLAGPLVDLGVDDRPPVGLGLLGGGPPGLQRGLEVLAGLLDLRLGLAETVVGVMVQMLGLRVGVGLDLLGLLLREGQHVLDAHAQMPVGGLVAGGAAPPELLDLGLQLLDLDHQPVDLRDRFGPFTCEGVHLELHLLQETA